MSARRRLHFLLSPAHLGGQRGRRLLGGQSSHPLALAVHSSEGAPIGEVFTFVSSLYFRGKLTYARRFGAPGAVSVITAAHGLVDPDWRLDRERAEREQAVGIDPRQPDYRRPFERDLHRLQDGLATADRVVLLGSLRSRKYVDVLLPVLGERLLAPRGFQSLGEMQRGSRLLRAVTEGELDYEPVASIGAEPPPAGVRERQVAGK